MSGRFYLLSKPGLVLICSLSFIRLLIVKLLFRIHILIRFTQEFIDRLLAVSRITISYRTAVLGSINQFVDTLSKIDYVIFRDLTAYNNKFVASDSIYQLSALRRLEKTTCYRRYCLIACQMSFVIVNCLKAIHID